MNFIFDENVNPQLAERVSSLSQGHVFQQIKIEFGSGAKDEKWIQSLATREEHWIVVSGDLRRIESKAQAIVLKDTGLTWVMLPGMMNRPFEEQAALLVGAWPALCNRIKEQKEPWIYKIIWEQHRRNSGTTLRATVKPYKSLKSLKSL